MKINLGVIKKKSYKRYMHLKRKLRIRKKINGVEIKPRLSVFRSISEIYVQVIDDSKGVTLASLSSLNKDIKKLKKGLKKVEFSKEIGKLLGKILQEKGIQEVVFDRNGFGYKGRIAALADGAREVGLKF